MKNWNGWAVWALLWFIADLATVLISAACVVHYDDGRYDSDSVLLSFTIVNAVFVILTFIGIIATVMED